MTQNIVKNHIIKRYKVIMYENHLDIHQEIDMSPALWHPIVYQLVRLDPTCPKV